MAAAVSAFGFSLVTVKGIPCTRSDCFKKIVTAVANPFLNQRKVPGFFQFGIKADVCAYFRNN
jgi:hypothetical protein